MARRKCFNLIRSQKILETTANDFLAVLETRGLMAHLFGLADAAVFAVATSWFKE
jgi:hypothetical protein